MSDQPKYQEQLQNLSDDDLESVAGGNAPDAAIAQGKTKVFNGKEEEKIGILTAETCGPATFG